MKSLLECKQSLVGAIAKNNGDLARQVFKENKYLKEDLDVSEIIQKEHKDLHDIKPQCPLVASAYVADNAWCLAGVYDAREVLQVMREFGVRITEANSQQNTFLHCVIARASIGPDDFESKFISTLMFIKSLATDEEYTNLLLAENGDGLRPLELAFHLGTFSMFRFLFETSGLYMSKISECSLFSIQYFDITDYVLGPRMQISPPYTMLFLDQRKMNHKSIKDVCLNDPMKTWINAINCSNSPYIMASVVLRITYILNFFISLVFAKIEVNQNKKLHQLHTTGEISGDFSTLGFTSEYDITDTDNTLLLISLLYNIIYSIGVLLFNTASAIMTMWLHRSMRWKYKTVTGDRHLVVYRWFYIIANWITVVGILILSQDVLRLQFTEKNHQTFSAYYIDVMALIAVFVCIWDVMYYLQLVPGLNLYVIAVQRMLVDFLSFGVLFILFFFSYVFGFYILSEDADDLSDSMYGTFQLMLNMINYAESNYNLQFLHVAFTFMIVYLLLNILIAIFTLSFNGVYEYKDIILMVQCLSVSLLIEPVMSKVMGRFHNYLRKKYLVFENGRVYVTKIIVKPDEIPTRPLCN